MQRFILFTFSTCFVAALAVVAFIASPIRDVGIKATVHPAMLDIIRCSPPAHPDGRFRSTMYVPESIMPSRNLDGLLFRTDIYDPNDCGRVITQARSRAIMLLNQARSG